MEEVKLFDEKFGLLIKGCITGVALEAPSENIPEKNENKENIKENSTSRACSCCKTEFKTVEAQREHYKLDWHRYNLKQNLLSKPCITEEQFNEKSDDVSSISGSDTDSEDNLDTIASSLGKVYLKNEDGKIFSLYRCLLAENKKVEINVTELQYHLNKLHRNQQWCIFMLGGGHFAGAIFKSGIPILHKTFHSYVVRAGQGRGQSSRDNIKSAPKSAGASIRRYNELQFIQHVCNIVENWREEIAKCHMIFYRASGTYNRSVLFGGNVPVLDKSDSRLRSIPFSTRRATFAEVKRVNELLLTIKLFDNIENAGIHLLKKKQLETRRKKTNKVSKINRAKSRESIQREIPGLDFSSSEESISEQMESQSIELSFEECLQPFNDPPKPKKGPKKHNQETIPNKINKTDLRKQQLLDTIKKGDLETLKNKLSDDVNEIVDNDNNTLLHAACLNLQIEIIKHLLSVDANVCLKNKLHQTPYSCMQNKEVREVFKEFAKANPEKFNYNKAQIPLNLNPVDPEEAAERKRIQKKQKREKEKEKRKEKEELRKEKVEQEKFANLSDREKRALAAERRILSQAGTVISRCFLCGVDISGKVPFEYANNRFCSVDCLKAHRLQNPVILS